MAQHLIRLFLRPWYSPFLKGGGMWHIVDEIITANAKSITKANIRK